MSSLFLTLLNMSITAGLTALTVMIVRLPLKKAPRIFSYVLWAVVLFRLVCPISFTSMLGIVPVGKISTSINSVMNYSVGAANDDSGNTAQNQNTADSGLTPINEGHDITTSDKISAATTAENTAVQILSAVWMSGMALLIGYGLFSYLRLKRRLAVATPVRDNIYETDRIKTPFVLGFIRPKIYIPANICGSELEYVLRHEQTHIKRLDHIIKPVSFLALAVHWFNPVIWISYILMVKDMEMSCDENVIKHSDGDIRTNYSSSLLSMSIARELVSPLAFGEGNVKQRIKNVLNYKKPTFWVIIAALIVIIGAGVVLSANPHETIAYKNENLGLKLELSQEWKDRYIVEESENSISFDCKEVHEKYDGMGGLFTIMRQTGDLITDEDIAQSAEPEKILLKGNGYTYILSMVSDMQYPPDDAELSSEYSDLFGKIADVYNSISLLGNRMPEASNDGYKVVGTSIFTVEISESWSLKALEGSVAYWDIYEGNNHIGEINMIPYNTESTDSTSDADGNTLREYVSSADALREVGITLNSEVADPDTMQKIKSSLKFADGPFNVIDLQYHATEYVERGGEKIFGKIDSFEMKNGKPVAVNVEVMNYISDDKSDNGFSIEDLNRIRTFSLKSTANIAPLVAPDYNTYGIYEMPNIDESFIEKYPDYKDFYYDFIIGSDGGLKIVLGHYIP